MNIFTFETHRIAFYVSTENNILIHSMILPCVRNFMRLMHRVMSHSTYYDALTLLI